MRVLCFLRAYIVCILLFTFSGTRLFAQLSDNFGDGDFSSDPPWTGDTSKFDVANKRLVLHAPAETGQAFLSTQSASIRNATWQFSVVMDFNPSSSNASRVYLTADKSELGGSLNGYYVSLGENVDEIALYRQTGLTKTKIIDGLDNRLNLASVNVTVRVFRDEVGNWTLASRLADESVFTVEGKTLDGIHPASGHFGLLCIYSATRSDKFSFDDFFVEGEPYIPIAINFKEIIFTEVFPDPSPSIAIPEVEFAEIHNRSNKTFDLGGFTLSDGSSKATLPSFLIEPLQYVILCSADHVQDFISFGATVGISGFPSLNNSNDQLILKTREQQTVDSITYDLQWYKSSTKSDGGWSLELIDPENICAEEDNWTASENVQGGTPGKQNSVYANKPDLTAPYLKEILPENSHTLLLTFSEKLKDEFMATDQFILEPDGKILSATFIDRTLRTVRLELENSLHERTHYSLRVHTIRDCAGNEIQMDGSTLNFGLAETADANDVIINEVLFNPSAGGVDFVELYNRSRKFFNLAGWTIARDVNGVLSSEKITGNFLFAPSSYLAFTPSSSELQQYYPKASAKNFYQLVMPNFPDDTGIVVLSDGHQEVDRFSYDENMHSPFLKDNEGVSLERISFDQPASNRDNWRSASTTEGYGTPGYRNSNSYPDNLDDGAVSIDPEIFLPVFGQPDFARIQFNFLQAGFVANVNILDQRGRPIKSIATNALLGTEGFFRWDGDNNNGQPVYPGYYLVWFEVFGNNGSVTRYTRRVVVAAR